jgi:MFS family permease
LKIEIKEFMIRMFSEIPNTIKAIGLVSFLLNTSTLMVFSIFGIYLHDKLGIDFSKIGLLDGAVESISFITKVFSGIMSDFFTNRKFIFLIGAVLLFIAKPLEAISTNFWSLFQTKVLERFGNGLQATPRDAMVGDWAPADKKATCFGIRQSSAAFGSIFGSVLAAILLKLSDGDYPFVFWIASIPSLIAVFVIVFFIKDKKRVSNYSSTKDVKKYRKISIDDIKSLGFEYWLLIGGACTYMISKVGESIVILYVVSTLELPGYLAPICMFCYQLSNTVVSFLAGVLSDKFKNRDMVIIFGIASFLLSDILFIFGNTMLTMVIALMFLGAYIGISQSIFHAKIIDIVPEDLRGTGIGIFNFICALSLLSGGMIIGHVADSFSLRHSFIVSSVFAGVSLVVLFMSRKIAVGRKNRE